MELENLNGNIIGVISNVKSDEFFKGKYVKEVVLKKPESALKMVGLDKDILDLKFDKLSISNQNRVIIASKLQNKVIVLYDISVGLTKKEIDSFKALFKKITNYDRKIILVDNNSYLFLNCVDKLYVINNGNIIFETSDIFSKELNNFCDLPLIVKFINELETKKGIKINHYTEFDELLKAIYRIKS